MPYVVLPPFDTAARGRLAESRWSALVAGRPELAAPVELQRHMVGAVLQLTERFEREGTRRLSLPAGYLTAKLKRGIPALAGEPIPVPTALIKPTILELCRILQAHGGGEAAVRLAAAAGEDRLEIGPLATLTLRREQAAIRTAATQAGLGHDLLWLVADMGVSPFAHMLRFTLFDTCAPASPLRLALDHWTHGCCPLCGTWPTYADGSTAPRLLRCAFCAAAWSRAADTCVYCGTTGDRLVELSTAPERAARGVQACRSCRGYLKLTGDPDTLPFPLLPIGDLETLDLDMRAIQEGFARPAIRPPSPRR